MSRKEENDIRRRVYKANPGNVWNPLCSYPRNDKCFCGSDLKAKKCCLPDVVEYVSEKQAEEIKRALRSGAQIILKDEEDGPESTSAVGAPVEGT